MKNKKCRGCEYYIIGGSRRCRAIQQYLYEEFKKECICRDCNFRPECIRKSGQVYKTAYPTTSLFKELETCELFDYTLKTFLKQYADYGMNTCYRDFHANEVYLITTRCTGPLTAAVNKIKEKQRKENREQ